MPHSSPRSPRAALCSPHRGALPQRRGEHWYSLGPFALATSHGLVDIFQPDVLWVGGITHTGMNYPYGQHLAFVMPVIPWGERSEGVAPPGVPLAEMITLPGTPAIKDGFLVPSDAPGFGIEVDRDWLERAAV